MFVTNGGQLRRLYDIERKNSFVRILSAQQWLNISRPLHKRNGIRVVKLRNGFAACAIKSL